MRSGIADGVLVLVFESSDDLHVFLSLVAWSAVREAEALVFLPLPSPVMQLVCEQRIDFRSLKDSVVPKGNRLRVVPLRLFLKA